VLSYRHAFHAGGWADVHKHVAFTLLLAHLRQKPTPFAVVDAFAGDAVYDLGSPEAIKTQEFESGIGRIWDVADVPAVMAPYFDALRAANPTGELKVYPGSPAIARAMLRDGDRLILNELHPTAHRALADWGVRDPRIAVHKRDAAELVGAVVTPQLRRGVILIDPAYEVKAEYETMPKMLARAVGSWPQGIYALWYPVLAEARHRDLLASLHRTLADIVHMDVLVAEIVPPTNPLEPPRGMRGAGMVIINPPWRFYDDMKEAGDWLADRLWRPRGGSHSLRRLAEIL
jgi:23S rRNA (adenine2030-N6)-methyltransferase